jgi:zinc finger SWIM domain-containing protein 3
MAPSINVRPVRLAYQPTVLFSQNKLATSNQPAVLFCQNKSAPVTSNQPNEQAGNQDSSKVESGPVENYLEGNVPKVGMKFHTEQEAYDFYNAYAGGKGFNIRRSSSHKVKNSTTAKNRTFCCSLADMN